MASLFSRPLTASSRTSHFGHSASVIVNIILLLLTRSLVRMTRRAHDTWSRSSKSWCREGGHRPHPETAHQKGKLRSGTVGTPEAQALAATRTNVRTGEPQKIAVMTMLPRATRTRTKTRTMLRGQRKKRKLRRERKRKKKEEETGLGKSSSISQKKICGHCRGLLTAGKVA